MAWFPNFENMYRIATKNNLLRKNAINKLLRLLLQLKQFFLRETIPIHQSTPKNFQTDNQSVVDILGCCH